VAGRAKSNSLGHLLAVLVPKVPVSFHGQGAAVLWPSQRETGGDIDAGLNATSGEEVTEIVVGDSVDLQCPAGTRQRLFAFAHFAHGVFRRSSLLLQPR